MNNSLASLIRYYNREHSVAEACRLAVQQAYPDLTIRWSNIYGPRWSYLNGSNIDEISLRPVRIRINSTIGICIDNTEQLSSAQLDDIVQSLKECLPE